MAPRVTQLNVYPVKGCKGIPVTSAALLPTGLPYDRNWMVVRADTGKFITARQVPKLLLAVLGADWGELQPGAALVLSAPGMSSQLQVPLQNPAGTGAAPNIKHVTVWEWSGAAADEGDAAADWLSTYLGLSVRLVRHLGGRVPDSVRPVDAEFAPSHTVKFADGYPVLVAMEENLKDLNARLSGTTTTSTTSAASAAAGGCGGSSSSSDDEPLSMRRFRPNIVLAGATGGAWVDDKWKTLTVGSNAAGGGGGGGGAVLKYVKPCDRCKVTTIDPDTAEVGDEPLKVLGEFRSGKQLGWADTRRSWTHAVFFAWNAVVEQQGRIAVGDEILVAEVAAA